MHFNSQYQHRKEHYQNLLAETEAHQLMNVGDPRVQLYEPLYRELMGKVSKLLFSLKPNTGGTKPQHPIANHTLEREPAG